MPDPTLVHEQPVTYAVVWRVKPGRVTEFESFLRETVHTAAQFPGHQGVHAVTPLPGQPLTYRVVARFDSEANFQAWRDSAVCQKLVAQGKELAVGIPAIEVHSGLEAWFEDPQNTQATPARYKTAILMWAVLFPLTLFFRWLFLLFSVSLTPLVQTGLMMAIEIVLVSYLVMPQLASVFRFWLYPEA